MQQSRLGSLAEACVNTFIGLLFAIALNYVLMRVVGIHASAAQNAVIVLGHTIVSVVRQYMIRRVFNRGLFKRKLCEQT